MSDPKVYTRDEAAKVLKVSLTTFKRLRAEGQITASYHVGNRPYFTAAYLAEWVAQREAGYRATNVSPFGPSRARKGTFAKRSA